MDVKKIFLLLVSIIVLSFLSYSVVAMPISFVSPTPADGTITPNTSAQINISLTEANLNEFKFNWNGTNYTMYNDSLVLMMNLDNVSAIGDNSTFVRDISNSNNNGTIAPTFTYTSAGKYGRAGDFTGYGNITVKDNPTINFTGNFTVSFCNKLTSYSYERFISKINAGQTLGWMAYGNFGEQTQYIKVCGATTCSTLSIGSYEAIAWHCWAFVKTGNLLLGYKDGSNTVNNSVTVGSTAVAADLVIGRLGAYALDGYLDEPRIWNRALSSSEISQQYISNLNKYDTDKWRFLITKSSLTNGIYTYFGSAKDSSGNENSTETRTLTVETVTINFASPTETSGPVLKNNIQVNVTASAFSGVANITINLYNSTKGIINSTTSTSSPFFLNFTGLADGLYYFNASTYSNAGRFNSTETRNVTIDTILPVVNFMDPTPLNGTITTNLSAQINISITNASDLKEVKKNWNGTNYTMYNDSLVLMMNFDNVSAIGENATKAVDVSKYGNNGTINGSAIYSTGRYGGAYQNNYVNIVGSDSSSSPLSMSSSRDITISAWIYPLSQGAGPIVSRNLDWNSYASYAYYLDMRGSGRLLFMPMSPGVNSSTDITLNKWHHVVVTYAPVSGSGLVTYYVDGSPDGTAYGYTGISQAVTTLIGTRRTTDSSTFASVFNGTIDEVRIWNRSLSAAEIKQQYYSNLNKYDTDKWVLYENESNLDGTYTYYGYAKDTSGNENSTETRTLTAGIPDIHFVSPTPINGTTTTNASIVNNVSITEANLKEVKKNWNGTNYTFYNDSLLLMMNLDNVSAIGENATKAVDVSRFGNNGTLGNATAGTQPTWNATGRYGGAYTFDGVNDYIETPQINIGTGAVTFSAWVKGNVMSANHEQGIIEFYNSTRPWFFTLEKATYNNTLTIYVGYNDQTPNTISSPSGLWPASDTNWHYVLMTRNSSEMVLYFDGNRVANSSHSNFVNFNIGNKPVRVGYPSEQYWNGSIDEVRVWNRSLSADEIKQQYYSNLNKYDTDKWIFYENESLPEPYGSMTYNYYSCAKDTAGNENCTETRQLTSQSITPLINFVSPTPENGTNTTNTSVALNVSITEANLNTLTKNWNGTNYTFYNDSLVLMMNFDNVSALGENSTFVKDLSKYGNNGNCSGTGCPNWNATGRYGGAYTFDGVNDYVTLAQPISGIQSANYSISAWVRQSAGVGATNFNEIFYQGYDGAHEIRLELNVVNCYAVFNTYEAGYGSVLGTTNACDGKWHYLTAVKSGTTGYIYVDGNQQNSSTVKNVASTDRATIGAARYTGGITYFFNGSIDEVRIWNRSLSAAEIQQQYYSNLNKYDADKWIFYKNESLPEPYSSMTYNYYSCVKDTGGNENCTETRTLTSQAVYPGISFASPTPENGTNTTNTSVVLNVSITEANLKEVKKSWNGINYTFYNDSLVLMMNFDNVSTLGENSSLVKDLSKYGNNGNCSGATCPTWNASGKYGGAYTFDGVSKYFTLTTSYLGTINHTECAWFQTSSPSVGQIIYAERSSTSTNPVKSQLYLISSKITYISRNDSSIGNAVTGITTILANTWYHACGVKANNVTYVYLNGVLEGSNNSAVGAFTVDRFSIGAYFYQPILAYQSFFNGTLDELRTWNRSLSADEIKQHYYSNLNKYDTDKWVLYENESNLSIGTYSYFASAKDNSGNENLTETRSLTISSGYVGVGGACDENSDCESNYCRDDYDPGQFCAATSTDCVHDGTSYSNSTVLYYRWACSSGLWIEDTTPPVALTVNNVEQDPSPTLGYYWDSVNNGNTTVTLQAQEEVLCRIANNDNNYSSMVNYQECTFNSISDIECKVPGLSEGRYNYYVSCRDLAGNDQSASNNTAVVFGIDYTKPTTNMLNTAGNHLPGSIATVDESDNIGTTEEIITKECHPTSGCTPATIVDHGNTISSSTRGTNYLRWYSTDAAGNQQDLREELVTVNSLPVVTDIGYGLEGSSGKIGTTVTFYCDISDANGGIGSSYSVKVWVKRHGSGTWDKLNGTAMVYDSSSRFKKQMSIGIDGYGVSYDVMCEPKDNMNETGSQLTEENVFSVVNSAPVVDDISIQQPVLQNQARKIYCEGSDPDGLPRANLTATLYMKTDASGYPPWDRINGESMSWDGTAQKHYYLYTFTDAPGTQYDTRCALSDGVDTGVRDEFKFEDPEGQFVTVTSCVNDSDCNPGQVCYDSKCSYKVTVNGAHLDNFSILANESTGEVNLTAGLNYVATDTILVRLNLDNTLIARYTLNQDLNLTTANYQVGKDIDFDGTNASTFVDDSDYTSMAKKEIIFSNETGYISICNEKGHSYQDTTCSLPENIINFNSTEINATNGTIKTSNGKTITVNKTADSVIINGDLDCEPATTLGPIIAFGSGGNGGPTVPEFSTMGILLALLVITLALGFLILRKHK